MLLPVAYFLMREIQRRHETDQEVSMFSGMHHEAFIIDYYELMPFEMDNVSFLFDFGKTLREAKRYNDSNAVFRQGTQVSSDPMFWVLMGNNYRDMQCYQEAEEVYQKAFAIMPNRLYPLYQLMGLYEETGMWKPCDERQGNHGVATQDQVAGNGSYGRQRKKESN